MSANVSRKKQRVEMHGSGLPMSRDLGVGENPASGSLRARAGKASAMKENKNWWGKDTRACTHARTRAHTHTRTHTRTHTHTLTHTHIHTHTHARTHARTLWVRWNSWVRQGGVCWVAGGHSLCWGRAGAGAAWAAASAGDRAAGAEQHAAKWFRQKWGHWGRGFWGTHFE